MHDNTIIQLLMNDVRYIRTLIPNVFVFEMELNHPFRFLGAHHQKSRYCHIVMLWQNPTERDVHFTKNLAVDQNGQHRLKVQYLIEN